MSDETLYAALTACWNGMHDPHWKAKVRDLVNTGFAAEDPFAACRVPVEVAKPVEAAPVPPVSWRELILPILTRACCYTRSADSLDNWYGLLKQAGIQKGEGEMALNWLIKRGRQHIPDAVFPNQFLPYVGELKQWLIRSRQAETESK